MARRNKSIEAGSLLLLLWWLWPRQEEEEHVTSELRFPAADEIGDPAAGVYTVDPEEQIFYAE